MDEKKREKVALFRYGVISPLIDSHLEWGDRESILKEISEKEWDIPFSDKMYLSKTTVINWYKQYRDGGGNIEALYPKKRRDKGKARVISPDIIDALVQLRKDNPKLTTRRLIAKSRRSNIFPSGSNPSDSTIYRLLKQYKPNKRAREDRRKFEVEMTNDLWQSDCMHGPRVDNNGKKRKSYLFAIIDDHSRLITHAEFYLSENTENFLDCLWKALQKRGVPRKLYTDNGASFRSNRLRLGCADIGIGLRYAKPYQPQGKGKIERFFRTIRSQFLSDLYNIPTLTLNELNERLNQYLNDEYHTRKHGSTGETPVERYQKSVSLLRNAPQNLPNYFRKFTSRVVGNDRTVKLEGRLFEAPHGLIGQRVALRYENLDRVEVYLEEESVGFLTELNQITNSRIGRLDSSEKHSGGQLFSQKDKI